MDRKDLLANYAVITSSVLKQEVLNDAFHANAVIIMISYTLDQCATT